MSTGGRVFPSITGGGITRAVTAIFDARTQREARALAERQVSVQEQTAAVTQFQVLQQLVPIDTPVSELPEEIQQIFFTAFGVDPATVPDLIINQESLNTLLSSLGMDFITSQAAIDSGISNDAILALFNLPRQSSIDAQNAVNAVQQQAFTTILGNVELMRRATLDALGDDPVTVVLPSFGDREEIIKTFDTPTAANIWAASMGLRDQLQLALDLEDESAVSDLVAEVQAAVLSAGFSISSPVVIDKILPLYNASVAPDGEGVDLINRFLTAPSTTRGEQEAILFLIGSIGAGDNAFLATLAPQVRDFLLLGQAIRDIVGPEAAAELLIDFTAIDTARFGRLRNPLFGRLRFDLDTPPAPRDFSNVPAATLILSVQDLLEEGQVTRESLVRLTSEAVVLAAETNLATGEPEGVDEPGPPLSVQERRIDRQQDLLASTRIQLENLEGRLEGARNPQVLSVLTGRIEQLRERVRIGETDLPFELSDTDPDVPQGGINPASVPASVRADVEQLNTLIRRKETGISARQSAALSAQIRRLVLKIRTQIASL